MQYLLTPPTIETMYSMEKKTMRSLEYSDVEKEFLDRWYKEGENEDHFSARLHGLERCLDFVWGKAITDSFPSLKTIHRLCVEHSYTESNPFYSNDGDNSVCYIPNDHASVIVTTSQNTDIAYWWGSKYKHNGIGEDLHIRRCFRMHDYAEPADDGHQYPRKYSLKAWKDLGFPLRFKDYTKTGHVFYGDCRDSGYIASIEAPIFRGPRVERSVSSWGYLRIIHEVDIPCTLRELKEQHDT